MSILSLFGDPKPNCALICSIRKKDIPKLVALLGNKDPQIATAAHEVLLAVLHVRKGADIAKWWRENSGTFSMKNYLCNSVKNKHLF